MQDRTILRAALRVLMNLEYRTAVDPADIDLLKSSALPDEIDLDLDDLANRVALRVHRAGRDRWRSNLHTDRTNPWHRP